MALINEQISEEEFIQSHKLSRTHFPVNSRKIIWWAMAEYGVRDPSVAIATALYELRRRLAAESSG